MVSMVNFRQAGSNQSFISIVELIFGYLTMVFGITLESVKMQM
jgi:hypothetical protein